MSINESASPVSNLSNTNIPAREASKKQTKIRLATRDDISVIWELARELAKYEKLLDNFTVTPDRLAYP
jgi:hypothetical protein